MSTAIQITPWAFSNSKPKSLAGSEGEAGFDRLKPGEGVVGGEGKEAWELKGSKPHLLVLEIGVGVSCSGDATRAGGSAAEKNGRGGAPVSYSGGNQA